MYVCMYACDIFIMAVRRVRVPAGFQDSFRIRPTLLIETVLDMNNSYQFLDQVVRSAVCRKNMEEGTWTTVPRIQNYSGIINIYTR